MLRWLVLLLCTVLLLPAPLTAAAPDRAEHRIPVIAIGDLPPEAPATLARIKKGGPFSYARDGAAFHNFERRLPVMKPSYYRQYTVPTPGARDRGARRIVAGRNGELYYTDDHYRTFRRIQG
jgi:ribonuclease T1